VVVILGQQQNQQYYSSIGQWRQREFKVGGTKRRRGLGTRFLYSSVHTISLFVADCRRISPLPFTPSTPLASRSRRLDRFLPPMQISYTRYAFPVKKFCARHWL